MSNNQFESSDDVVLATLRSEPLVTAELVVQTAAKQESTFKRSWVFAVFDGASSFFSNLFGICSIIVCTSIAANIPVFQFLSFGYLLEISGRIARGGQIRESLVGLSKVKRIGGIMLGTWLLLIPVRFFSDNIWYEAFLIDPASTQTTVFRIVQYVLIVLTIIQIVAAWFCGGKLRYFFWPLIAPFSFGLWITRTKLLGSSFIRPLLSSLFDWIAPNLTNDICNARSPQDWFVPAILWRKIKNGGFYFRARDGIWDFVASLNLWYYLRLGFVGFVGTVVWLFVPTILLVGATRFQGGPAIACGVMGTLVAIPVFAMLLFVQTHFAKSQTLVSFFQPRAVFRNFSKAPYAHLASLLLALLFAIPLFLLKVEEIPAELLWSLSIVFMLFSLPSRIAVALAYRRGVNVEHVGRWWLRWPAILLALPVSAAFVLILTLTRYVSWHGAFSMIENHVFLLPAPFWL